MHLKHAHATDRDATVPTNALTSPIDPDSMRASAARPVCVADREYRAKVRDAVLKTMDRLKLDAFFYPRWTNPPRLIGDLNTPHGGNSQFYSPTTGFPAINVPMGFSRGGVFLSNASSLHLFRTCLMGTGIIYFAMNGWCYFQVPNERMLSRGGSGRLPSRQQSGRERSPEAVPYTVKCQSYTERTTMPSIHFFSREAFLAVALTATGMTIALPVRAQQTPNESSRTVAGGGVFAPGWTLKD